MILPADYAAPRPSARRVLFLNANETMRPYWVAPLGLAFVASATSSAGHEVRFVDLPETAAQHRAFRRVLSEWPADYLAVGIRNLDNSDFHGFESYLRQPAELVAEARRARPAIRVIMGGPAATVDPQLVLRTVQPDHVKLGEGEESLSRAIARLKAGERLPAIIGADRESGAPYRVLNTGALSAPRLYEWVTNLRPYLRGDAGYPLQTKRGCPLKCTYGTYGRIEGTRYRFLDPQVIAAEVEGAMARGVHFSIVCDPAALRRHPEVDFINGHIAGSPHLQALLEPLAATARPGATFPTNARVRRAATHDAALVGDASGYIDPLTGEGIYAALWTADELTRTVPAGWRDLLAALEHYARLRARRQHAKALLCEAFQHIIRRPLLANSTHWLLSRRQPVADAFIGVVGNSYPPAHGLALMARHAFSP